MFSGPAGLESTARMGSPSNPTGLSEPRRDSRVGLLLADRYRIDALVDQGAMGRVYVGEHVLMKKRVAIKVLHRELTTVPEFVARFEREAMAAANIDNEHVVAATDFGKLSDGAVFLVLEFIVGKNLRDEMAPGPFPLVRALHITRQIAYALRSAHALGIVHRDLKPENVMLVEKAGDPDFVKVLDFGIAKVPMGEIGPESGASSRPITKAGMIFGTPEYMPPEQALGQNVDARADLYSLGVMTFEMLAGCRPFAAESQVSILGQQVSAKAPPISRRAPGLAIPAPVERFVARLLEREASRRFQSADEVLAAIDETLGYAPGRRRIPTLRDGTLLGGADTEPPPARDPFRSGDDDLPTSRISIPGVSHPFERLGGWVDARRSSLPGPLRALPLPVLISVPFAVVGVVVGFGIVSAVAPARDTRSVPGANASAAPSASTVASGAPPAASERAPVVNISATSSELARATEEGPESFARLRARYPLDPDIPLAESGVLLKEKDTVGAIAAIRDALALDGNLKDNAQIASALWVMAQNKKSATAAFALLKGPMGRRGVSILHDLTTTPGVRDDVRDQARRVLAEVERHK
jgi:serine/threonine protein kinase